MGVLARPCKRWFYLPIVDHGANPWIRARDRAESLELFSRWIAALCHGLDSWRMVR